MVYDPNLGYDPDYQNPFQMAGNLPSNTADYGTPYVPPNAPQQQYSPTYQSPPPVTQPAPSTRFPVTQPAPADISGLGGAYDYWANSLMAQPAPDLSMYGALNTQAFGPTFGQPPPAPNTGDIDWTGMGIDWTQTQPQPQPAFSNPFGLSGIDPWGIYGGTSSFPQTSTDPFTNQTLPNQSDPNRMLGYDYLTQGGGLYGQGSYFGSSGYVPPTQQQQYSPFTQGTTGITEPFGQDIWSGMMGLYAGTPTNPQGGGSTLNYNDLLLQNLQQQGGGGDTGGYNFTSFPTDYNAFQQPATSWTAMPGNLTPAGLATARNNNAAAMYPGSIATMYGATGMENLLGGQYRIATFDTPTAGAAANFQNLSQNYAGMNVGNLIYKWSGGSRSTIPGYSSDTVITQDMINDPNFAIPFLKAIAGGEAPGNVAMSPQDWQQAHDMFTGSYPGPGLGGGDGGALNFQQPTDYGDAYNSILQQMNQQQQLPASWESTFAPFGGGVPPDPWTAFGGMYGSPTVAAGGTTFGGMYGSPTDMSQYYNFGGAPTAGTGIDWGAIAYGAMPAQPAYDYGSLYGTGAAAVPPSAYDYGSLYGGGFNSIDAGAGSLYAPFSAGGGLPNYGGFSPYTPTAYGSGFSDPYAGTGLYGSYINPTDTSVFNTGTTAFGDYSQGLPTFNYSVYDTGYGDLNPFGSGAMVPYNYQPSPLDPLISQMTGGMYTDQSRYYPVDYSGGVAPYVGPLSPMDYGPLAYGNVSPSGGFAASGPSINYIPPPIAPNLQIGAQAGGALASGALLYGF